MRLSKLPKAKVRVREIKMAEEEDTRLTYPHKHIKTTTANRATLPEINLGTSKTALLQPKLGRKSYTESGRRRGKVIWLNLHP